MPNATPGSIVAFSEGPVTPVLAVPGLLARAASLIRRDRPGAAAVLFLCLVGLVALSASWITPYPPGEQLCIDTCKTMPPSLHHWFGTDQLSRDVLSRVIDGTRVSLSVALLAVLLATVVGMFFGAVAGYTRGAVDVLMMRTVDAGLAIPRILLLLVVSALWGRLSVGGLILLLGFTGWFGVSRLVRGEVLAVSERDFIAAARGLGVSPLRVVVRHVIPQVLSPLFVAATVAVGNVIVVEAGLSFLGHGIPQPRASWGSIINDGRDVWTAWWLSLFPGLALASTVLAVNILSDRLRRVLDPRHLPAP